MAMREYRYVTRERWWWWKKERAQSYEIVLILYKVS